METKYGGYTIKYHNDEFTCETEESTLVAATLSLMKNKIDKLGDEPAVKQKPQPALQLNGQRDTLHKYVVGSFGMYNRWGGAARLHAWVTKLTASGRKGDRSRQEMDASYMMKYYNDTPETRATLEQVVAIQNAIDRFKKEQTAKQDELLETLESQTVQPTVKSEELPHWDR